MIGGASMPTGNAVRLRSRSLTGFGGACLRAMKMLQARLGRPISAGAGASRRTDSARHPAALLAQRGQEGVPMTKAASKSP
jgi:hypothetical protein